MTSTKNLYFIITRKPEFPGHISAGCICYISEYKHRSSLRTRSRSPIKLPVFVMGSRSGLDYDLEVSSMEELSAEEAELLLALSVDAERLKWFKERDALRTAKGLTLGTEVTVEEGGAKLRGILRYIGRLTEPTYSAPLPGTFFGIELQGENKRKVKTDGSYQNKTVSCKKDCDLVVPFSRVRPVVPSSLSPSIPAHSQTEELNPGDRVTYFVNDTCRHGMVVDVLLNVVRISTDTDENGKRGGEVDVPLESVFKGEVPAESESMDVDTPPVEPNTDDLYLDLSVNSLVEVTLGKGSSYGIIRWIGSLPTRQETMAGLELEEDNGVSDGTFKSERFFSCPPKRALFVKLSSCRPDSRFQSTSASHSERMPKQEDAEGEVEHSAGKLETVPPISTEQVNQILIGRMKGIQGHCNSCYMDAALFSLFSCSSVLDSMLFKSTEPQDAPIQNTLLHDIVNPLRSKGFVEGRHIMKLRKQLQNHGYSHSFTTDEKDPEEFLTVIMHHILALDPLLKLSAAGKVQESYCYQIFLDQNHSLVLPTVQQLLEHSFHTAGLKLAEVPSCLILQMPRFGKKFKMFDKIIPSLELDITDLLSEGPQQCMLCGNLAQMECPDCFTDPLFSRTGFKIFCKTCSSQVHSHPQRRSHQPAALGIPEGYAGRGTPHSLIRDKLELFAVLCIETSHYVSFIKHGRSSQDWIFFDSMADRQGERDGFNIPEVHACPEVGVYLEMSPAELANQVPRDMKGVAKRLFCDAYMYLYQSTNMCLYR
ncbi:ubiquitin carboxyl-terminal hydrolase CYLD isoform X1 [Sander lucioperca]|uniref:ubiquitin carboxyl-terminal hydrolase CYLD isoform X1 n=1 Tax=Sander lucioperca TaxID=283035 RepID=UPI00125DA2F5|nr:ubiquitin carboxyl-terminal hydrolase CYLD isoform X1 [Sander lucioperca]XP_035863372.1 ubiquitin carboxyl-terminal hydrolase CYLD isoform X1 [Sander lucioperca]XP_035863373.1 ubiquitin carboxyl-terminal hydrolase CYLD isoform X1 [Sander lucioperca]XP_035863374.1 ubiquitin carboxyl-terminal hydrolase CYLD isoform X1 [Sander lucioperca]